MDVSTQMSLHRFLPLKEEIQNVSLRFLVAWTRTMTSVSALTNSPLASVTTGSPEDAILSPRGPRAPEGMTRRKNAPRLRNALNSRNALNLSLIHI